MATITAKSYTTEGKASKDITLPEAVFGLPWNADLVHQVVNSMLTDMRTPVAHTKTRGEVSGGGKKPWKQKGTGRARHGSTRSPIWVGGGVAHGPRNDKNFDRKVNRKMKAKALFTILSKKLKEGEIVFVDTLNLKDIKTKFAKSTLEALSKVEGFDMLAKKTENAAFIALAAANTNLKRAFANMGNVMAEEVRNINPLHLLKYKYLIVEAPSEAIAFLENKLNDAAHEAKATVGALVGKPRIRKASAKKIPAKPKAKTAAPKAAPKAAAKKEKPAAK